MEPAARRRPWGSGAGALRELGGAAFPSRQGAAAPEAAAGVLQAAFKATSPSAERPINRTELQTPVPGPRRDTSRACAECEGAAGLWL